MPEENENPEGGTGRGGDGSQQVTVTRADIQALEERAAAGDEATQRAEQAERNQALLQAGVDLDDADAVARYDGFSAEQIGQVAEMVSQVKPEGSGATTENTTESETPGTQLGEEEAAALGRAASLPSGASGDEGIAPAQRDEIIERGNERRKQGADRTTAMAGAMNEMVNLASQTGEGLLPKGGRLPDGDSGALGG